MTAAKRPFAVSLNSVVEPIPRFKTLINQETLRGEEFMAKEKSVRKDVKKKPAKTMKEKKADKNQKKDAK